MKINIQNKFKKVFAFLKLNTQKKVFPLLVALTLLLSCLAGSLAPVHASGEYVDYECAEVSSSAGTSWDLALTNTFGSGSYAAELYSVLYNMPRDCVMVISYDSNGFYYGVKWGTQGGLALIRYYLANHTPTPSMLGVHLISEFEGLGGYTFACGSTSWLEITRENAASLALSKSSNVGWLCGGSNEGFHYATVSPSNSILSYGTGFLFLNVNSTDNVTWYYPASLTFTDTYRFIDVPGLRVYNYSSSLLYPGLSQGFNVALDGVELTAEEILEQIAWSVSGNSSAGTTVNEYGVLTVGPDETARAVNVTAALKTNTSVNGSISVAITPLPDADELTLLPARTEYTAGQPYYVKYYLAFADGTEFDYDGFVWAVDTPDTAVSINSGGYLYITSLSAVGSFSLTVSYPWDDAPLKSAYITLADPNDNSSGDSSGGSSSSGSVDMTETNEKLDDILSGGEAGEQLGGTTDEMDNKNEELGGVMDEYENAQSQMPTTPSDVSGLVNMDDFNAAVDTLALVLKWDEMGIAGMYIPMAMVLGVSALCYIVFGKKR